jgi:hypothetical protein
MQSVSAGTVRGRQVRMAWNLHLSVVRGRTVDDLAPLGFELDPAPLTVEEATQLSSPAVAQAGDDLVFIDGAMVAPEFNVVLAARLDTEVVTAMFGGACDTYVWSVLRGPDEQRTWAVSAGETVQYVGEPLPEESAVDSLDEDALFTLLDRRTALPDDWLQLPAYRLTMSVPAQPKRRGFFRRR